MAQAIKVRYRGHLQEMTHTPEETLQAGRVQDVLAQVKKKYGAAAYKEAKSMLIAVDGQSILLMQRFKTPLPEGATLSFLPLCGGG